MAAKKIAYIVFVFPVIASLLFGAVVLSEVLGQPDRKLNMWQFNVEKNNGQQGDKGIRFVELSDSYPISTSVNFRVAVNDTSYECGDLYLTVYDYNTTPRQIVTQQSFFSQCFAQNHSTLPIGDSFTSNFNKPGLYHIVAQIKDKSNQNSMTVEGNFKIK